MTTKRIGSRAVRFGTPPVIRSWAAVGGPREGRGPLGGTFDRIHNDSTLGEKSWEKAESAMQREALELALEKGGLPASALDLVFAGDLMNQCIASSFALRSIGRPLLGLYGACSTMAESLLLAAMAVESGCAAMAAAVTSSHYASAERQYRTPLEYGAQRTPSAQWTATASGAAILAGTGTGPRITWALPGRIADLGVTDTNNMGAAMAPAACDTLCALFADTGTGPADYDRIVTGDLGLVGHRLLRELLAREGIDPGDRLDDCGMMLFRRREEDVHAGGSGCGCSAGVLCGHLLGELAAGRLHRMIFAGTGALLSPTSAMQGESIPGICHAVVIEAGEGRSEGWNI